MSFLLTIINLEWWVYVVAVITFFCVVLILNYIVKKINESRLEERFMRLQNAAPINHSVQSRKELHTKLPPKKLLEVVVEQSNPPTVKEISLVFNKDNLAEAQKKDQIDIRNFPNTKKLSIDAPNTFNDEVEKAKIMNIMDLKKSDCFTEALNLENKVNTGTSSDSKNNAGNELFHQNQPNDKNTSDANNTDNVQEPIIQNDAKIDRSLDTKADDDTGQILENNDEVTNTLNLKSYHTEYNRRSMQQNSIIKIKDLNPGSVTEAINLENKVDIETSSDCKNKADKGSFLQDQANTDNTSDIHSLNITDHEQDSILQDDANIDNSLDSDSNADNDKSPIQENKNKVRNTLDPKHNTGRDKRSMQQNIIKINLSVPKINADDDNGSILQNKANIQNSSNPRNKDNITRIPFLESMYAELSKIDQCKSSPLKCKGITLDEKSIKTKGNISIPNLKKLQQMNQEDLKKLSIDLEKNVLEPTSKYNVQVRK